MIDSIINYIQRNPLTTIIVVMLLVFAPSAFGALLIGVAVAVLLLMAVPLFMLYRVRRAMKQQEREQGGARYTSQGSQQRGYYTHTEYHRSGEGEVKVHATSQQPAKRVSDDVGDYVDFEEVKEQK